MSGLTYIGNGAALIGVPARDLTDADLVRINMFSDNPMTVDDLIKSGLYQRPGDFDKQDAKKILPHVKKIQKEGE